MRKKLNIIINTLYFKVLPTIMVCVCYLLLLNPVLAKSPQRDNTHDIKDDIRVLVDISGSMKRNDPSNLRQPALRLFVSLLPTGSRSGVWTFGQWVNMLIKHGPVNMQWKKTAGESIKDINSTGLFTNIEAVLRQSTKDWTQADPNSRRSLILLTDGLVDISDIKDENEHSRLRIINEILPQLQKANVTIHTIALSKEADINLLQQLSSATDGMFEIVETADGLERLFLRMFDKVAKSESLPLNKNVVKVDSSIKEMTFLIFRGVDKSDISITSPSGIVISRENLIPNSLWHRENRYDLVTIVKPETGNWKINAELDPDNRVMIVTDLKLVSTRIPNSLLVGSKIHFKIHLEDKGKIIDRKDFLYFLRAKISQSVVDDDNREKKFTIKLKDNGKKSDLQKKDGIYSALLKKSLIVGEHELEIVVNGTTFKRYFRQQFNVYETPVSASIEHTGDHDFIIRVIPYQTLIDVNTMKISAIHKTLDNHQSEVIIPKTSPSEWSLVVNAKENSGNHTITLSINGQSIEGDELHYKLAPLEIMIGKESLIEQKPIVEISNKIIEEPTLSDPVNWLMVILKLTIFNLFLGVVFFGLYKLWPKLKTKFIPEQYEELDNG